MNKKRAIRKAPKKLSTAIMLAVKDLTLAEQDPKYRINMDEWHRPYDEFIDGYGCEVCFAGSVIAKTLPSTPNKKVSPDSFGEDWYKVFLALNNVRVGEVADALVHMDLGTEEEREQYEDLHYDFDENIGGYEDDANRFKDAMIDLAAMLRVNGF